MVRSQWSASVKIKGPVSLSRNTTVNDVTLKKASKNIRAYCLVEAETPQNARDIAIRKINNVLDTISYLSGQHVHIDGAFNLSSNTIGTADLAAGFTINRILDENEFEELNQLNTIILNSESSDFSRALSYYRKGLGSADPFDSFMSFFQSIEIIIRKYHNNSRDQLHRIEDELLELIDENRIYNFEAYRQMRNRISHGLKPRDLNQIRLVSEEIPGIKTLASKVLKGVLEYEDIRQRVLGSSVASNPS